MYPVDFTAIRAQVEDGVPWRDGVLTYSQAMALLKEVERLEKQLREANRTIERLKGMLS
jgi:hypothetical protein